MRIAIIGSGISGLVASYHLNKYHDITVFEAESWVGGHTHTVNYDGLNIDTGFIVFNDRTYPNFKQMLDDLKVEYQKTEMSFSVRHDGWNLEYNGCSLNTLFANRINVIRPKFYKLLYDILKFNKLVKQGKFEQDYTLGDFIKQNRFGEWFVNGYILPMGSAIWSMGTREMLDFPLSFFAKFFINHGLLDLKNRPQWYTIKGGSKQYITPLINHFKDRILLNTKVTKVVRKTNQIVITANNQEYIFDKVVFACHSTQALGILDEATNYERDILSKIKYSSNEVVLHTDINLLPREKRAYASWNYLIKDTSAMYATVTYNMNILQCFNAQKIYCVTLNATNLINPQKILAVYNYAHPIYSAAMLDAQSKVHLISGQNNTHFCGAYWHNGFHEDGVVSALRVCKELGVEQIAY